MHDIEPYYRWRDKYVAAEDQRSPFYQREYNEFQFTNSIYNFYIHPQWDFIGSPTLYIKILFVDYEQRYAIIELIGEWNDCVTNDIMYLKRDVADYLIDQGIVKFILICENVLNFHSDEDDYYAEWIEDIREDGGYIVLINMLDHVESEMAKTKIGYSVHFGDGLNGVIWRGGKPSRLKDTVEGVMSNTIKKLPEW